MPTMSGRPLDVLEASLDEDVTVNLKDGRTFYGSLVGYDQHMNVVLESTDDAEETPVLEPDVEEVEDTTIIRGDNVVTIRS
jgi:small nuclear ribonucleoprotein